LRAFLDGSTAEEEDVSPTATRWDLPSRDAQRGQASPIVVTQSVHASRVSPRRPTLDGREGVERGIP
jgi:hypothetical protein